MSHPVSRRLHHLTQAAMLGVTTLLSRLITILPNVSLLGSVNFFTSHWLTWIITTVGFDLLFGGFYKNCWVTYLAFLAYPILGRLSRKYKHSAWYLIPTASFLFFLISNLGVWWYWYPRTWTGLVECYLLAVPFYKNTLLGDLVFGWGWLTAKAMQHKLQEQRVNVIETKQLMN